MRCCHRPDPRAKGVRRSAWVALSSVLAACSADTTPLADGTHADWSHWRDRPIVLNYWAEWCAPCRHEIPELNALHRERAETGTVILGVNYDGITGERLTSLVQRMHIEFPVLVEDPIHRWDYARPEVLPTTVIVGSDGEVQEILVGPQTRDSIRTALRSDAPDEGPPDSPPDLTPERV